MTVARITFGLCVLLLIMALGYLKIALSIRMPMLSDVLGPRMVPVTLGWLLVGAASLQAIITLRQMLRKDGQDDLASAGIFLLAYAAMLVALLLLSYAGYVIFAFTVVLSIFWFADYLAPLPRMVAAATMALVFHAVFAWGLGVPFPKAGVGIW